MLESRLNIKNGFKHKLSLNHILSCSATNQACDGGYSYLVSKFGHDINLIPEDCEVSSGGKRVDCAKRQCKNKELENTVIRVNNYKFVGGSYGKSNEEAMMRDIHEHGPQVCSFAPGYEFNMFKSGIYSKIDKKTWKMLKLTQPEWVKVEHSVLCVGWGKYIIKFRF